jgi:hypothetical protein
LFITDTNVKIRAGLRPVAAWPAVPCLARGNHAGGAAEGPLPEPPTAAFCYDCGAGHASCLAPPLAGCLVGDPLDVCLRFEYESFFHEHYASAGHGDNGSAHTYGSRKHPFVVAGGGEMHRIDRRPSVIDCFIF